MKNKFLLTSLFTVAVVAGTILLKDGLTYLIILLMALTILGAIRVNKPGVMKITRWAKANPKKAQWLIAGLQLFLLGLGVITGKNLKELGYQFSDITTYVFGAITIIGFLSVPFWPKRNAISIPKVVDRQRLAYLAISLCSLIMTAQVGNRIGDLYPNSPITHVIEKIDRSIFSDKVIDDLGYNQDSSEPINQIQSTQTTTGELAVFVVNSGRELKPIDQSVLPDITSTTMLNKAPTTKKEIRKENKNLRKNYRKAALAASSGTSGIAIFFLVILVCVGACLFAGGIGALAGGEVAIGIFGIVAGPLLIWLAVKGFQSVKKKKQAATS